MERFNFYDVYGYVLPGLVTLGLFWLPFRIVAAFQLPSEWSATFVALVLAYVVGHILQFVAAAAFPSQVNGRFYSATYLDDANTRFSPEVKRRLVERIKREFDIDVTDGASQDLASRDARRADAFMMCRQSLIQEKVASYAEQFQGLYAFMRGVGAACVLGAVNYAGWAVATVLPPKSEMPFLIVVVAYLVFLVFRPESRSAFWIMATLSFASGVLFGNFYLASTRTTEAMLVSLVVVTLILLFVARRMLAAYDWFAGRFAETVYRDFCARPLVPEKKA